MVVSFPLVPFRLTSGLNRSPVVQVAPAFPVSGRVPLSSPAGGPVLLVSPLAPSFSGQLWVSATSASLVVLAVLVPVVVRLVNR
ncbi:hypothetical protein [Streptacidiphilus sp. P02-A3a]|uniref:hypothetical protein n=1 Tax=Streptacidiphilus sp. P02-A3a TaxID=2704468 RepID=UPI0015FD6F45|nr:hypothetical protein [Streptacidiphilus sp. P02-A3a]QMU69140.1 hypothetical protein GXP74_13670 [Streptacidiphilus sp. P02-A3a]